MAERITAERMRELRENDNCEDTDETDVLLTRGRREWLAAAEDLAADLIDARAELAAQRAILDGRTTPPTEAEIVAHHAAGGFWLVRARLGVPNVAATLAAALDGAVDRGAAGLLTGAAATRVRARAAGLWTREGR